MGRELGKNWDKVQGRDSRECKMIKMINYMFWVEQVGVDLSHPHPLLSAGVPATPRKSLTVTSND